MSEYQYYEFQAIDRPLDEAARTALRAISTRARITATSFVNSYEWGDLKADPRELLKRHFDLFLYLANWGSRRLALRLPKRLVDLDALDRFELDDELASVKVSGEHLIIDIHRDEIEIDDWNDGGGWLAALAPLRAEILAGDLRLFVLLWLMQVEYGWTRDEAVMPAPGLGPLTGPLVALAEFLAVDADLLEAAARLAPAMTKPSPAEVEAAIRALTEDDKIDLLRRLHDGDPHVRAELRRRCRKSPADAGTAGPTAGELRTATKRIGEERRRVVEERAAAERRRRDQDVAAARAKHLVALTKRGESPWCEVEDQIALRHAAGYDRAATLLADLGEIAVTAGTQDQFAKRLADIRARHERKGKFIERLDKAGLP
jgi:hypothetical protein